MQPGEFAIEVESILDGFPEQLFIEMLPALEAAYPTAKRLVLILDNYVIHKSRVVNEWLEIHPRLVLSKELAAKGSGPVLKRTRWLLPNRPENLTEKQEPKLAELL